MAEGKKIEGFVRTLKDAVARTTGRGPDELATVLEAKSLNVIQDLLRAARSPVRGNDHSVLKFQNDDGTFPHMVGYDGPVH